MTVISTYSFTILQKKNVRNKLLAQTVNNWVTSLFAIEVTILFYWNIQNEPTTDFKS